jgi:hypothetical protein
MRLANSLTTKVVNSITSIVNAAPLRPNPTMQKLCDDALHQFDTEPVPAHRSNPIITYYPQAMRPHNGRNRALLDVLAGIQHGEWATQINAVRATAYGSDAYSKLKKALPAFTASGTFKHRSEKGLLELSGIISIDIDAQDNTHVDLAAARQQIEADPSTYACFASTGGQGLVSLVPIPIDDHPGSFRALEKYYQHKFGLTVDTSCKSVSSLRYVSYDPTLYLNQQAAIFNETLLETKGNSIATGVLQSTWRPSANGDGYGQLELEVACQKVRTAPDGQKHCVLNKMAFLCGGYVGTGFLAENEARLALRAAISSRQVDSLNDAFRTIEDGLRDGQRKPLLPTALQQSVRQQLRQGKSPEQMIKTIAASQRLPEDIVAPAVYDVVHEQEQAQQESVLAFWDMIPAGNRPDAPRKPKLSLNKFQHFLTSHGFYKLPTEQRARIVRLENHVVQEVTRIQFKDFVRSYLSNLPAEVDGTDRKSIEEMVLRQHKMLFENEFAEFLQTLDGNFIRDTATYAYLFYRNCVVVATKDGVTQMPYTELPGFVWQAQLIPRDFVPVSPAETEAGTFSQFLHNLAGKQADRLHHLKLFLGYYLHGYKDPSNTKIGILLDENAGPDGQANGGTGKSLLFKALSHIVPVLEIDGRGYDARNAKELQQVTDATRIIVFNDLSDSVPFERLLNMASDTLTVDRHYLGKQSYPFEGSPKLGITTNGLIKGQGASYDRRRYELEVSAHYSTNWQPRDEFGHTFFSEWSLLEWSRFDALMVQSVCLFLGTGGRLSSPVAEKIRKRRLQAVTSEGFVDFMDALPRGKELHIKELFSAFRISEHYDYDDDNSLSNTRFGTWINCYEKAGVTMERGQYRAQANRGKRWIKLTQPDLPSRD